MPSARQGQIFTKLSIFKVLVMIQPGIEQQDTLFTRPLECLICRESKGRKAKSIQRTETSFLSFSTVLCSIVSNKDKNIEIDLYKDKYETIMKSKKRNKF